MIQLQNSTNTIEKAFNAANVTAGTISRELFEKAKWHPDLIQNKVVNDPRDTFTQFVDDPSIIKILEDHINKDSRNEVVINLRSASSLDFFFNIASQTQKTGKGNCSVSFVPYTLSIMTVGNKMTATVTEYPREVF